MHLNTNKADKFIFSGTSTFTTPLVTIDVKTTSTIIASIPFLTVASISCDKKVIAIPDNSILHKCEAYKLMPAITLY